jgi:hypothetical protein
MDIIPTQLNYSKNKLIHPFYKLSRVLPLSGSQTTTITSSGGQEVLFEIPSKCFNLARSYLSFDMTPAAGGALNFNNVFADCLAPVRQIQVYTRGGLYLCDINEVGVYTQIVSKAETKLDDFMTYDRGDGREGTSLGSGHFNGIMKPSGVVVGSNPRWNIANSLAYPYLGQDYIENDYFISGTTVNTAGPSISYRIPLYLIRNSLLSLDKDLLFDEVLIFRLVFGSSSRVVTCSTTANAPFTGPTAFTGSITVNNLQMLLSIEQNQDVINSLRDKMRSPEGLQILLPYIYTNKSSLSGTSQSITLRYNRAHGINLQKIYYSVYHANESSNTAYDHGNYDMGNPITNVAAPSKISSFYTMLNNQRNQEFDVRCHPTSEDYLLLKEKIKGSVILSSGQYNYNWFWMEDFTTPSSPLEQPLQPTEEVNMAQGIDLSVEQKYDWFGTMVAGNYNHYAFSITQKILSINANGINIS